MVLIFLFLSHKIRNNWQECHALVKVHGLSFHHHHNQLVQVNVGRATDTRKNL